jgi:hypothetical protein
MKTTSIKKDLALRKFAPGITLLQIDKITKKKLLTNRKEFKWAMNTLRTFINECKSAIQENVFITIGTLDHEVLDLVDTIKTEYKVTDQTICNLLQVHTNFLYKMRASCNRAVRPHSSRSDPVLLKDRLMYVNMIKNGLATRKEVQELASVSQSTVSYWMSTDAKFGLSLDKACAFRHARI